ncbi:septum formation family protein [Actinomadura sp. 1N219]|uniref:DUF4190 domain-containing protein n=1 Tax=Actinomadura sp. 1N219 TaxID=3375152 RepID=UPI003796EB6A
MTTPPPTGTTPDTLGWAAPDASDAQAADGAAASPPGPPLGPPFDARPPSTPVPARTNRLAIAALVTGLCGLVLLAIGLAVAALVRTGRRAEGRPAEKGRGLAIGGLAASAVWIAATVVAVAAFGGGPFATEKGRSALSPPDGYVLASTLKAGDCFTGELNADADPFVSRSPCNHPHNGEVVGKATLPGAPFPGHQKLTEQAAKTCKERIPNKVRDVTELELRTGVPGEKEWKDGDRGVTCMMVVVSNRSLTTPLAALDTGPPPVQELKRGDCIEKWTESATLPIVACTQKHEFQVFAVYEMRDGKYPGEKALLDKSEMRCAERAVKIWGARMPLHLVIPTSAVPTKESWNAGYRQATCMVTGKKGSLTRSVVPH